MALRTISLCAGVGGLDLGVRIAEPGSRCVCLVEREISAAASLVASMEAGRLHPAAVWSDLRSFDAGAWRGAVDCVLSGDPCQGNSVAGKRLGQDDDRWLLDRAIEVFDQSGASVFFRENVVGNCAGQLAVAIPALERLGCRVAVGIFSAGEAGASHRRERLFILAIRDVDDRVRGRHGDSDEEILSGRNSAVDAGGDYAMAHPLGPVEARRIAGAGEAEGGRAHGQSGGSGGALAHADGGERRDGHLQRGGQQRFQSKGDGAGRTDVRDLADASSARSQGRELDRACDNERHGPDAHGSAAELRRACLPAFAPGPGDPRWPDIIARAPQLEPAVGKEAAQFIFRGLAHGMAERITGGPDDYWRSSETLCRMWEAIVAQAFWCATGRPWSLSSAEVLRSLVHGRWPDQGGCVPLCSVKALRSFEEDCVRGMRGLGILAASSRGPELAEQQAKQSADALHWLSHAASSCSWRHYDEEAETAMQGLWQAFLPSLRSALQHLSDAEAAWNSGAGRIEELRHCGNGVVPLAAALAWVRLHALLADDAAGDAVRFADDRSARAGAAALTPTKET